MKLKNNFTRGTDFVPVAQEISFRSGGQLKGVVPDENSESSFFLESGMGQYSVGTDVINFGPRANSHNWAQMRGILSKQNGNSYTLHVLLHSKKK